MRRSGSIVVALLILILAQHSVLAQDLFMRRQNSAGNWRAQINNDGVLFNQTDTLHERFGGAGGAWIEQGHSVLDTLVFGAGIWFGGLRRESGVLTPRVEFAYDPASAGTLFFPGSLLYDGPFLDTTEAARDKYRVYRSTDLVGPAWPVRMAGGSGHYIDDVQKRTAFGPPFTIGDEDMFVVYKRAGDSALPVEVRSEIAFWKKGMMQDVAIVHNEVLYLGQDTIFSPVLALALDGDIEQPDDDRLKGIRNEAVQSAIFFTDTSTTDPMLAVTMLRGQHGRGRTDAGLTSLRYWDIFQDPQTDSDRYAFVSERRRDTALSRVGDARLLMVSQSAQPLLPGDTLYFDYMLFAMPASGRPALDPVDSSRIVSLMQLLTTAYYRGTLSSLRVMTPCDATTGFDIFPNPVQAVLRMRSGANDTFVLRNPLGVELRRVHVTAGESSLDVLSLTPGAYFLQSVTTGETRQFVKLP